MKKLILSLIISVPLLTIGCADNKNQESNNVTDDIQISQQDKVKDENIFATIESSNSWAIEPTAINLVNDSAAVVKVKILSVDNSKFISEINSDRPTTPINVEIIDNLSGDSLSSESTIYTFGGEILISDMINYLPKENIEKMGLDKLNGNQKANNYISYISEYDYDFEIGSEYIVILYKQVNDIYTIASEGYGVFKFEDGVYKNVLTNEIFTY